MNAARALRHYARKVRHWLPLPSGAEKLVDLTHSHVVDYLKDVRREVLTDARPRITAYREELPNVRPLNVHARADLSTPARLNVVLPSLSMRHMSGGPNSVINLGCRMATRGVPVRFVGTDAPMDRDLRPLRAHMMKFTQIQNSLDRIEFACGFDRSEPLYVGENDVFLATAWWTAHAVHRAMRSTRPRKFIYVIQDFEPGFYHWGTEYALAQETYDFDFVAVINSPYLADYLCENRVGRFRDQDFIRRCAVLQIAVDQKLFYCEEASMNNRARRLLFYARPSIARRNLYELGIAALYRATQEGLFPTPEWELTFIGEDMPSVDLGKGVIVRCAPWLALDAYAELMRHSDIVLSLMFSPHPSYPPLEAAACGSIAVTSHFASKTEARLRQISENIVPVDMTVDSIFRGLKVAKEKAANHQARVEHSQIKLPRSWDESFDSVLPRAMEMWSECLRSI